MSSFFKVLQNRTSQKLFALSNLPSSPTLLRTTLEQTFLRRASWGPGVVPRKQGAAERLPGASFVGPDLRSSLSGPLERPRSTGVPRPLRAGRLRMCQGRACSYKPWGQGAPWRPRPERGALTGLLQALPTAGHHPVRREVHCMEGARRGAEVQQEDSFGAGSLSWPCACLICARDHLTRAFSPGVAQRAWAQDRNHPGLSPRLAPSWLCETFLTCQVAVKVAPSSPSHRVDSLS